MESFGRVINSTMEILTVASIIYIANIRFSADYKLAKGPI